jgi:NAD(P)-dependent dehydrogenase (short-subunit alcohol dehydrogenase family)
MTISFKDKVAIITGAGGGVGKCHALELAKRGARVVVNDLGGSAEGSGHSSSPAQQVADEIVAAGGEAIANYASVSDEQGAASIVQDAMGKWGRIDIVINNAGILRDKSFSKVSSEDFHKVVDVHLWGSVYVTKAAWPHMITQQYGRILMTTSSSGLFGNFGQTNYGTAKMGVIGLMNSLKQEGAKYNIRINAIAPVAATRLTEALMPEDMKKALDPKTVTPAALYLCSEQAPSGIILQAAGGHYQRVAIVESKGKKLGVSATVEDIATHFSEITDLAGARPKDSAVS